MLLISVLNYRAMLCQPQTMPGLGAAPAISRRLSTALDCRREPLEAAGRQPNDDDMVFSHDKTACLSVGPALG